MFQIPGYAVLFMFAYLGNEFERWLNEQLLNPYFTAGLSHLHNSHVPTQGYPSVFSP